MMSGDITWLCDWSDWEHEAYEPLIGERGGRVIRTWNTGSSIGTRTHHLRSYPAYLSLAARSLAANQIVCWQPLAAIPVVATSIGRSNRQIVAVNPILKSESSTVQRSYLRALNRCTAVTAPSGTQAARNVEIGLDPSLSRPVLLGSVPAPRSDEGVENYVLAGGRERRDWQTLAAASLETSVEIRCGSPGLPSDMGKVHHLGGLDRDEYVDALSKAKALVVPILDTDQVTGTLSVVQALRMGIPVIATANGGTSEYITSDYGALVPPSDPAALAAAIERVSDESWRAQASRAALDRLDDNLSFGRVVDDIHGFF